MHAGEKFFPAASFEGFWVKRRLVFFGMYESFFLQFRKKEDQINAVCET